MKSLLKIIIYDSTNHFTDFAKSQLTGNYKVDSVFEFSDPDRLKVAEYDEVIFIINDLMEAFDLLLLYPNAQSIHVSTDLEGLAKFFDEIKGIRFIDGVHNLREVVQNLNTKVIATRLPAKTI